MRTLILSPTRLQLWLEFATLFVGVPVLMLAFFGQYSLFAVIWLLAGVALALLWFTPAFSFKMLWQGPIFGEWRLIVGFWVLTALCSTAFVFAIDPEMFLAFAMARPEFWIIVMLAYPIASAWPQEIIFRSLFFERYGALFPSVPWLILANGAAFGFGHLFYQPVFCSGKVSAMYSTTWASAGKPGARTRRELPIATSDTEHESVHTLR